MSDPNTITQAGDYQLELAEIISYRLHGGESKPYRMDIKNIILSIELTEDVFNYWDCELDKRNPSTYKNYDFKDIKDYSLNVYEANVLVSEKEISDYFESVVKTSDIKLAKNWIMGDLFASLNDKNISISQSPVTAKKMAELVNSISSGVISGRTAKEVFEVMKETGEEPKKIIENKGLQQKSDPKELEKIIDKILTDNKDKVDQYKSGKDKLFGFFVGQVMKASGGTANPQLVNEILKKKLK